MQGFVSGQKWCVFFWALAGSAAFAQVAGPNVNMVSGMQLPDGDPFLQRQNEPSVAVSTRNPQHLLSMSNDYRTVDIANPFPTYQIQETGDAWIGVFRSTDGGATWRSAPLTGYPQDRSQAGLASPLKAYGVATDPTVRAGTHGMFYLSGLAFNRGSNAPSAVFMTRFQDLNNKENATPTRVETSTSAVVPVLAPFAESQAVLVDSGTSGQFLDKPWIVADVPRTGATATCKSLDGSGTTFTSGYVYLVWSKFLGNQTQNNPHSQITFARSTNCGATWSTPQKLSESYTLNQGTNVAVDPDTGHIYVVWRQMAVNNQPDSILWSVSTDGGKTFSKAAAAYTFAPGTPFDQPSSATTFRAAALPTMAIAPGGRVYVAFSLRGAGPGGNARIMITTLARGSSTWTTPFVAEPTPPNPGDPTSAYLEDGNAMSQGHQFLPSLSSAYGRLMLVFYDLRDDNTVGELRCPAGVSPCSGDQKQEWRVPTGERGPNGNLSRLFGTYISDSGMHVRHTMEVRGALVDPSQFNAANSTPLAFPTSRVTNYMFGTPKGTTGAPRQLQFNPPDLPMFVKGTRPFVGDYIDVAGLAFVTDNSGKWVHNTQAGAGAVFHAVWTDNRDVRPPPITCDPNTQICSQNWSLYTPAVATGQTSIYDSSQATQACSVQTGTAATTGSRNQNVYTTRITPGLSVYLRSNTKPVFNTAGARIQRAFSIVVHNTTGQAVSYRLMFKAPLPANTFVSFAPYAPGATALAMLDVTVPRKSAASRTVYVYPLGVNSGASAKYPTVTVLVAQIANPGDTTVLAGGMQSSTVINPDITNPDIINPDITNPDIANPDITNPDITNPDITSAEVFSPSIINPDITNPDIINPDIINPDIANPDITNPDITNPDIANPDITNPDITTFLVANPDITNPDITNPDIVNPDITNPDIANPDITSLQDGATDVTWKLSNKGNTSATYNAKLLMKQSGLCCPAGCSATNSCPAGCSKCQLIVRRTYVTPAAVGCAIQPQPQNITVSSVPNPPSPSNIASAAQPDNSPDQTNTTVSLAPGESGRITLRIYGQNSVSKNAFRPIGVGAGRNADGQSAVSLTMATLELPIGVVGTNYSASLQKIGGSGVNTTWLVQQGTLPAGVALNPDTGVLAGALTPASKGTSSFTMQVADNKSADRTELSMLVNQFSVTSDTSVTGPTTVGANGVTRVTVYVSNDGPAIANSPTVALRPVTLTGNAAAACTPASAAPLQISSNAIASFLYDCVMTGDGTVSFTANAATAYVNSAGTVPAIASGATSNYVLVDSTPPQLSVAAVAGTQAYAAGTWTNQTVAITFSCTDNPPSAGIPVSGVATGSPAGGGTYSTEGTFSVTGACADNAGNSASLPFGMVMIDKTAPAVTIASPANGAYYVVGSSITVAYTCNDGGSGVASCIGPVPSGSSLTLTAGPQTFTVLAADNAGNTSSATSVFNAAYAFTGFLTPLATAGTVASPSNSGTANYGNALPVKWQLKNAAGAYIAGDLTSLKLLQALPNSACAGPAPASSTPVVLYNPTSGATGNSTFRYDGSNNQYIFNWDTSSAPGQGCYNLIAQLNDGQAYSTIIKLN